MNGRFRNRCDGRRCIGCNRNIVEKSAHSTNVKLIGTDTGKAVTLYSGSAAQYAWMADFDGKTVTLDIAACNWNNKQYYRGCVLAVYVDGELVAINDYNFRD